MKVRRGYIDWPRGTGVLVMIEAHTFHAWTAVRDRNRPEAYRGSSGLGVIQSLGAIPFRSSDDHIDIDQPFHRRHHGRPLHKRFSLGEMVVAFALFGAFLFVLMRMKQELRKPLMERWLLERG